MLTQKHLKKIAKKKDTIKVGPTGQAYNVAFLEDLKNAKVKDSVITKAPFKNKAIKKIVGK